MSRTLPLALLATAAACADPPPQRDAEARHRPVPSTSATVVPISGLAPDALAAVSTTAASRLLDRATFGARPVGAATTPPIDSVEYVVTRGLSGAVNDLLNAPAGTFASTPAHTGVCDAPFDPALDLGAQFFVAALTGEDQLRLRTAYALHQILVVSENGIGENRATCTSEKRDAMTRYLNVLRSKAFSNYREVLEAITREPAMGTYLDMANNVGFDTGGARITPNENFARELLQLFTVGTALLGDDGEPLLDAAGNPRPAYTEARVQAFARTLTGWTYADPNGCPAVGGKRTARYDAPMIACAVNHDSRSAQLLNYTGAINAGRTTADATPEVHLEEALDNLFNHPNLPPFVSKQLIGHLVTSNPSPAYVARVVAVFKDDGTTSHRRGNLRAVIRAILLDAEAQAAPTATSTAGRLRSPVEMIARLLRSLGTTVDLAANPGKKLNDYSASMGQSIPRPPSVFSYYAPENPAPGDNPDDLVGPAFGVLDTGTIATRANFVHDLLLTTALTNAGVTYDLAVVPDDPVAMIDWIDATWMHGAMSPELRALLESAVADGRSSTTLRDKQLALYLAALSPEFEIQR